MLCTDELNAKLLCRQHEEAITNLTAENEKYDRIKVSITQFVEDPTIDSCGIRALKRQLEDYILIIDAIKSANDTDIQEYTQANAFIGDEYLFGRVVTVREERIKLKLISDAKASYYWGLYRASFLNPLSSGDCYREMAEHYDRESDIHQAVIDECTRIINKYDSIENSTYGLLSEASQYRGMIIEAILTMGQAFDGKDYNSYVNDFWRGSLSIDSAKSIEELYELGVTTEQIANMEEKGFSPQEILEMVNQCKTDTDRDFLFALMNKQYENAFRINPDDLSDEMFDIIADYHIHMYHFDSHNRYIMDSEPPYDVNNLKEFEEIEDFNNALLSASDFVVFGKNQNNNYSFLYLKRIADCTSDKMKEAGNSAGDTAPGSSEWNLKMAEYYRAVAAYNLLSSEFVACSQIRWDKSPRATIWDVKISDLNFDIHTNGAQNKGLLSYSIMHTNDSNKTYTDYIQGQTLRNGEELLKKLQLKDLEKARRKYEEASAKAFQDTLKNISLAVLSVKYPYFAALYSTVDTLANGDGQIFGLDGTIKPLFKKKLGVTGADYASSAVSELLIGILFGNLNIKAAKRDLNALDQEVFYTFWGNGSAMSVGGHSKSLTPGSQYITSYGTYDPGVIYMRNKIESEGLSWVEFGTDEDGNEFTPDYVLEEIKKDHHLSCDADLEPRVRRMCKLLLEGAPEDIPADFPKGMYLWYEVTGPDGIADDYDMEVFITAVQIIEEKGAVSETISSQFAKKATAFNDGTLVEN